MLTLLVHVAAVLPVVALCVVARLKGVVCHAEPFQYLVSGRCRVNVVLFAFKPKPPELSAALPVKFAGTVAARKALPPPGVSTDAVPGAVVSLVTVVVVEPTFPGASVTQTRMELFPSAREAAAITVAWVAGWLV
jgi:hypothetical protein